MGKRTKNQDWDSSEEDEGEKVASLSTQNFWENPVKLSAGLGIPTLLVIGLLWRSRVASSALEEQKRAIQEQVMAGTQSQGGSFLAGLNPMFTVPAGLCFLGLVYKCYKFKQSGKRKHEETMRTAMIIGGILGAFGIFMLAKPYLFPAPPKPPPPTFSMEHFSELGQLQKNLLLGAACAAAFGGHSVLGMGMGGHGGKHKNRRCKTCKRKTKAPR